MRPSQDSLAIALAACLALFLAGCATIVGGGTKQSVQVESSPSNAVYKVQAASGMSFGSGNTPATLRLPRKNEYNIEITMEGYQPQTIVLTKSINGWFWANIAIGGVIGMGIDAITGGMHKLEPSMVSVALDQASLDDGDPVDLAIVSLYAADGQLLSSDYLELVPTY